MAECSRGLNNCKGLESSSINYCVKGHVGALCEECDVSGNVWGEPYRRDVIAV